MCWIFRQGGLVGGARRRLADYGAVQGADAVRGQPTQNTTHQGDHQDQPSDSSDNAHHHKRPQSQLHEMYACHVTYAGEGHCLGAEKHSVKLLFSETSFLINISPAKSFQHKHNKYWKNISS